MKFFWILPLLVTMALPSIAAEDAANVEQLEQKAFQAAVAAVADTVVQIRTVGGLEKIGKTLLSHGPTTGVVISPDGYIVSSTLGFVQKPSSILVRLPDGQQVPAKLIARDRSRKLVLLKVESEQPLRVPKAASTEEIQVGQWAMAVGRTFNADRVGISVGVISAVRRLHGRAIQTDANVSTANYGGALVDLHGHVLGILVPMSPQSESELAGVQFYDSGIGFAVPLEHVLANLQRWKQGDDLLRGKLGVGLQPGNVYATPPTIATVWPGSPAAAADWKPQDVIVAVEDREVESISQMRFEMVPRYAGDRVRVTILRGEQRLESLLTLTGELKPFRHAFLGVLPKRPKEKIAEKTQAGIGVRRVWPESPAAEAGVRRGDRIIKIASKEVTSIDDVAKALAEKHPEEKIDLTIVRDEKELLLKATLGVQPDNLLLATDAPQPKVVLLEQDELKPLKLPEFSQTAHYFLPSTEQQHGLLLWLAEGDAKEDLILAQQWQKACQRNGIVLLIAHAKAETGWVQADLQYLKRLAHAARKRWSLDPRRLAVGGQGKAGQIAYTLAFGRRSRFRGMVSLDGPLPRTLKIPEVTPNRLLSILAIESRDSPLGVLLQGDLQSLHAKGYPASWLEQAAPGPKTWSAIGRWLDGLDRF